MDEHENPYDKISLLKYIEEKMDAIEKARELQAKEYERRLSGLNHEAEQLKSMQAMYTPREVFEKEIDAIRKEIKLNTDWKIKQQGKSDLMQFIPWILTAITIYLIYSKSK